MLKEFKEFAMRGNVVDLAVGVVIGAAFGAIVTSLVNDIIMPPIGKLVGGLDFKSLYLVLDGKTYQNIDEVKKAGAPAIFYGNFLNTIVNFLIVSFSVFLMVRQVNRFNKPKAVAAAPVTTKDCPYCLISIPLKAVRCPQCTSDLKTA